MKDYLLSYSKKRQYSLFLFDIIVIALGVFLSYVIRVWATQRHPSLDAVFARFSPWQITIILSHVFTLYLFDQYNLNRIVHTMRSCVMVVLSVWLAGLIISGVFFFFPKYVFGRQVLLIHLIVVSILMVGWRFLFSKTLLRRKRSRRLAVVGNGQIVSSFIEEMARIPDCGFQISGIHVSNRLSDGGCTLPRGLAAHENVFALLNSDDFDALAFDGTCGSFTDDEIRHILQLRYKERPVYDLATLYKNLTGRVPLSYVDGRWLLSSDGLSGEFNRPYVRVKRVFDLVLALLLLVITGPLLVLIAAGIKLASRGRVFYTQERLGIERRPFNCIKFRTMIEDAESLSGPVWSQEKDPRTTPVGRFLRKSRLDELPQLWNILKGEMSFVGPRPIREHFAVQMAETIPFYWMRYDVKPGVTGWAQANGVYAVPDGLEAFQYELFYIQNFSFFLDFLILMKTLNTMFLGKGK